MKVLAGLLSVVLIGALLAVIAQHVRYLRARRDVVMDRQPLFHASSVFHVATVVALGPEQELLRAVRGLVDASEKSGARVIYAGKVAVNAMASSQLPRHEWDAFVLAQYPSREAHEAAAGNPELQKARSGFAGSYALGMQRPALANLMIPIGLLGVRVGDIMRGVPSRYPFERASTSADPRLEEGREEIVGGLLSNLEYGKDAVVVLNFLKNGSAEERRANAGYGRAMMGMMAELGIGPMHMGRAVTLEGDAEFDAVAIVYYPGVEFFAEMVQSTFFGGISGGKQLGDTLSSPTVPLLPHL